MSILALIGAEVAINNAFIAGAEAAPSATTPFSTLYEPDRTSPLWRAWNAGHEVRRASEDLARYQLRNAKRDTGGL